MPETPPKPTVVLRYCSGRTVHGTLLKEAPPQVDTIELETQDGSVVTADLWDLKAVFFLKDPRVRQAEMELGRPVSVPVESALARVEFSDGEIVRGRVQHYSVADRGFFLYPTALESNNERIFVVASSVATVDIES
jgi:hypothetical protein